MSKKSNSCPDYHLSVTTCPNCEEENDLELLLIADFLIDEETGRPYAIYRYRCRNCQSEFDEELKWWE